MILTHRPHGLHLMTVDSLLHNSRLRHRFMVQNSSIHRHFLTGHLIRNYKIKAQIVLTFSTPTWIATTKPCYSWEVASSPVGKWHTCRDVCILTLLQPSVISGACPINPSTECSYKPQVQVEVSMLPFLTLHQKQKIYKNRKFPARGIRTILINFLVGVWDILCYKFGPVVTVYYSLALATLTSRHSSCITTYVFAPHVPALASTWML